MNHYNMSFGWKIDVPDNWCMEYDEDEGQWIYYPDNSTLTVRITPFHSERDGVPAEIEMLKAVHILSLISFTTSEYIETKQNTDGTAAEIYEGTVIEDGRTVYVINIGYFTEGELLSVNIYSESKDEGKQSMELIKIWRE